MPEVGLKLALVLGAAADILLGAWLLRYSQARVPAGPRLRGAHRRHARRDRHRPRWRAGPERLSSGVFRYGRAMPADQQGLLLSRRQDRFGRGAAPSQQLGRDLHQRQAGRSDPDGSRPPAHRRRVHDGHRRRAAVADQARRDALRQHRLWLRPHRRGAALAQRPTAGGHDRDRAGDGVRRALLRSRASSGPTATRAATSSSRMPRAISRATASATT